MNDRPDDQKKVFEGQRLRHVRENVLHLNQNEMAQGLGTDQSYISLMEKGVKRIGPKFRLSLEKLYRVNIDYIQGRSDEPLLKDAEVGRGSKLRENIGQLPVAKNNTWGNMIFVPVRKQAAFLNEGIKAGERVSFPFLPGPCFAFEVEDDLMAPDFPRSSFVVCTLVERNYVKIDKTYAFQTEREILIREVVSQTSTDVTLRDKSGKPLVLPIESIVKLYHIERKIVHP